ncbi:TetR/AcrR family transcriptional regulator [Streptomyces sp. MST-110588]|uniref:TetR/AcrR family transcriptional regulator n=1 Tax=Streptomyces sp. MST-110588 TaxID=2833628 RepID=UPI001F5C17A2|nr:TetR/AcrR family transcriptional regulator [Streptomyces sp. MST-110588]UNO39254.1 TetR/AcrR family transcriptional regulator [Streptomyces sp. MST-110588]
MDMAPQRETTARTGGARQRGSGTRQRLTAQDWADAALAAIGEGGLAAVAVEPLAARLGTTKGSFYWHFANREALIEAALARWEQSRTEAVITALETEPDPESRLRVLFARATRTAAEDPLEMALLATAAHPGVAAVLRRVTDRRIGYIAALFAELGFPRAEARRRGLLAYTSYLGHNQLGHAVPGAVPSGAERDHYLDAMIDALLHRDGDDRGDGGGHRGGDGRSDEDDRRDGGG